MLKKEIKVGGHYRAKVSGNLTTVRVDSIGLGGGFNGRKQTTTYCVTNLSTGRKTTFRSAAKFRSEVNQPARNSRHVPTDGQMAEMVEEVKQRSDPLPSASDTPSGASNSSKAPSATPPATAPGTPASSLASASAAVATSPLASKLGNLQLPKTDTKPHVIVMARAGTGKTTLGEEGLKKMRGLPTRITPSPQQQAVWDQFPGKGEAASVGFTAFGSDIAEEVKGRLERAGLDKMGCEGLTTHSMGNRAVKQTFKLRPGRDATNKFIVRNILCDLLNAKQETLIKDSPVTFFATEELTGLVKQTLTPTDPDSLKELAHHHGVFEDASPKVIAEVLDLVPRVIDKCLDPTSRGQIDFADMCWLPVVHRLPGKTYDFLIVDEAQDLNRARQEVVKMYGKRLCLVGDDRQAIFGFAGADAKSMIRMERDLTGDHWCPENDGNAGSRRHGVHMDEDGECSLCGMLMPDRKDRGCTTLPLTVTRRCGKAIVEEAKRIVPDFEAHPDNPEGKVSTARYPGKRKGSYWVGETEVADKDSYLPLVQDGDRVLCRTNAPLVSQCFKFIRMGRKANILGRDVGTGLLKLLGKLIGDSIPQLIASLAEWSERETAKENAMKNPSETRLTDIEDKVLCLHCFMDEGVQTKADVENKIKTIFTDRKDSPGIQLSSIHKSKGLESQRVFFLRPPGADMRQDRMKPWELEQNRNLEYVAITRAIQELIYVS